MNLQLMRLRKAAGYRNRDDFAAVLGINKHTYRSWESGKAMMSLAQACDVADILGCTLDELAGRGTPEPAFADRGQRELNGYWESMNTMGRDALLKTAELMADGESVRIEKNSPEPLRVQEAG